MTFVDVETTIETVQVMRQQEQSYQVTDYLAQLPAAPLDAPVDATCRNVMAKWCNDIADFCNYSRETAAIAMSCLDRFMACPKYGREILMDRDQFQLAAMTALYTAVKIHEHEAMDPALVSTLSRGAHAPEAVEAMEAKMLQAVRWRVNPPTAMAFVRNILDLVPEDLLDASERETVQDLTQFQVDLATCEYDFCQAPASSIAFASLLNAIETVSSDGMFLENFETTMSKVLRIDLDGLRDIRICLYEAVHGNQPMDLQITSSCNDDSKNMESSYSSIGCVHTSPRSVSA